MLTRLIAQSAGFRRLRLTDDDELDAALTLCGQIDLPRHERYCFQTTYLNDRWPEYRALGAQQRLIWVLRNPYSVVHSMVHNWKRMALARLYEDCGSRLAVTPRLRRAHLPWPLGPSQIEQACLSYSAKTGQIEAILELVPPARLLIIDYDAMVRAPEEWLPRIFGFIDEPYVQAYARAVRGDSLRKADRLSCSARQLVRRYAEPTYLRCLGLISNTLRA